MPGAGGCAPGAEEPLGGGADHHHTHVGRPDFPRRSLVCGVPARAGSEGNRDGSSVPSGRAMARRRPVPYPRGSCDRGARGAGLRPAAAGSSRPGGCTRPAWRDGPRSWGGSDHRVGLSPSGPFKEHDPPGCQAAWIGRPVAGAALGRGHGLCFPGGDTVSLPRSGRCGRSPHGPRPRPCTRAGGLRVQRARSHKVAASTSRGAGWQREVKEALTAAGQHGGGVEEMRTIARICGGTVGRA